ncbi:MAG: primosomal protein N' [Gammaproteobacteria bacterium]|nr:MAG: primosomal protein N' [Gammaproteobacteria bacterium]
MNSQHDESGTLSILRVALPCPRPSCFDYLPPVGIRREALQPGQRVEVPFGPRRVIGLLWDIAPHARVSPARLRRALRLLDPSPLLPPDLLDLLHWAARYYHHPVGEVVQAALPALLRQGRPPAWREVRRWFPTPETARGCEALDRRAPRQAQALRTLLEHPQGLAETDWPGRPSLAVLRRLEARGLVRCESGPDPGLVPAPPQVPAPAPTLTREQRAALAQLPERGFACHLLEGVTGSGKTEIYLRLIAQCLERGRQALLLVPEIGLTPQLVARLRARLPAPVAVLHSGLGDRERLDAWCLAREGRAGVVLGTRSAVFTPLARPGLFIVDEEHDPSLAQQEGFRYSARDLLVWRARRLGIPVLLGSATPSLESLRNAREGRYGHLRLRRRPGRSRAPARRLIDLRGRPLEAGLSAPAIAALESALAAGEQALVFLNRRGFAPVLLCHDCGWLAACTRCDARYTYHRRAGELRCHHCAAVRPVPRTCPACGSQSLIAVGEGTERLEAHLAERFGPERVLRIDRDTARGRHRLEDLLRRVLSGEPLVLVGTQMLAKGHDFPRLTRVVIAGADQALYSLDFRAGERLAQRIEQVAGRAGRRERPGEVLIQTHFPDHPLLQTLVREGYAGFARQALAERRAAGLPPYAHLALLRAEAPAQEPPEAFLAAARARLESAPMAAPVTLLGPAPAPMARRQGRHRAHLLLLAHRRTALHALLDHALPTLEALPEARRVRWSLDVDPVDLY